MKRSFKKYLIALCFGIFFIGLLASHVSAGFVEDIIDLPLMSELTLIDGAGFVYEQENGRIIEKMAIGSVTSDSVRHFYKSALPQLGWVVRGDSFYREKEELRLSFRKEGAYTVVTFHLSPED